MMKKDIYLLSKPTQREVDIIPTGRYTDTSTWVDGCKWRKAKYLGNDAVVVTQTQAYTKKQIILFILYLPLFQNSVLSE